MGSILLVRHGQASFGAADYDVLSETGWQQGRALGAWLAERGVVPTALVRGDMRRHRETLEAMLEGAGWGSSEPEVEVDAGWDEFDHVGLVAAHPELPTGDLDRRTFQRVFEDATRRWWEGAEGDYPETFAAFVGRTRRALSVAAEQAGSGQTVVVVTSGGPIGLLAADLVLPGTAPTQLGPVWSRFNTAVVNSSVTRVVVGGTGTRLMTFNEHSHVAGDLLTFR